MKFHFKRQLVRDQSTPGMVRLATFTLVMGALVVGCSTPPANYHDEPYSQIGYVADVVTENEKSITIDHSSLAKRIAFRLADEHCERMNKVAVFQNSGKMAYGHIFTSVWTCQ